MILVALYTESLKVINNFFYTKVLGIPKFLIKIFYIPIYSPTCWCSKVLPEIKNYKKLLLKKIY